MGSYALIAFILKPILSGFLTRERAPWFVVAATLMALLSTSLLFVPVPPIMSAGAMGVSLALGMPSLLALPNFLLPRSQVGQGYGLYQLLYSFGFFAQPLVGAVVDGGGYAMGYVMVAVYTCIGFAVALPIVRVLGARVIGHQAT